MNTYTYKIASLITTQRDSQRPNLVTNVIVVITGETDQGRVASLHCNFFLDTEGGSSDWTDFQNLTEQQVMAWVDSYPDQKQSYLTEIDRLLTTETLFSDLRSQPLPWAPPQDPPLVIPQVQSDTSSSNTVTMVTPMLNLHNQEAIKALIYEVLEEIRNNQV